MLNMYFVLQIHLNVSKDGFRPFKSLIRLALGSANPLCCFFFKFFKLFYISIVLGRNNCLESIEWGVLNLSKIHIEKIYNVVVQILRLENSSAQEKTFSVDVTFSTNAVVWSWVVFIVFVSEIIQNSRVKGLWPPNLPRLVYFPVIIFEMPN